jgi:hypothetical protein
MNPIRRELLNGLFVLVVASLMSTAVAAFQVSFNVLVWTSILSGIALAVGGYVVFEFVLSANERENEWLKRVGNPARLELGMQGTAGTAGMAMLADAGKAMRPGTDLTIMVYFSSEGGRERAVTDEAREQVFAAVMEHLQRGTIREYKRLLCYDHDVFVNDQELKSGILRVGEGPGTINRHMAEHCRLMLETKGCSLFVAPVVLRHFVGLFGTDKACMSIETIDQDTGGRRNAGIMFFCDPPNGEIIEQFRQMVRATERRMVAVHKIRFPEDAEPAVDLAAR